MRLIVGLGNPGEKYQKTRHNIGFMVLEKIAKKRGVVFRQESHYESRFAEMARLGSQGEARYDSVPRRADARRGDLTNRIKLVLPQTFMNESGRAIQKCKDYWKVASVDIWVIYDDVDLEFGKVRINLGGTSAGHKGVESIIQAIGNQFWRIRIGVGKSETIPTEEWVLMKFEKSESTKLAKIIDLTCDFVLESLSKGIKEQTISITNLQN